MAVSTAQATAMLGALPGTLYVQPHSGDPGAAGTLNTIAGAARSAFTLPAASGGQRSIVTSVDCPNVPAGASPSHVSYWNGPVGSGSFLFSEPLGVSVTFLYAGTLRFTSQVFTVTTVDTSGSQTSTSVVADYSAVLDVATGMLLVKTTDTTSQADVAAAFTGSGANDTSSQADSSAIRLGVVVADSTTQADTAARGGVVSDVTDTTSAGDTNAITTAVLSATTDAGSTADSNTASTGGGAHAAPTLVGSTAIAYSTSAGVTPTLPTVQAGDLLVIVAAYGSAWTPGAPPAGWTITVSPNSYRIEVLTRIATGSDSAPLLPLGSSYTQAAAFAFRGVSASTPIDVVGTDVLGATVPSITTVTDHAMVITMGAFEDAGYDVGDGETPYSPAGTTFGTPTGVATTSLRVGANVSSPTTRGLGIWYGTKTTPGATGTAGLVVNSPGNLGTPIYGVSFAIRPQ